MIYWLNILGLTLDIIGVIWLFIYVNRGLTTIPKIEFDIPRLGGFDSGKENADKVKNALEHGMRCINLEIMRSNEQNKRIHKKSIWGLILIVIGFLIQATTNFLSIPNN